jgi:hypothetical protein
MGVGLLRAQCIIHEAGVSIARAKAKALNIVVSTYGILTGKRDQNISR